MEKIKIGKKSKLWVFFGTPSLCCVSSILLMIISVMLCTIISITFISMIMGESKSKNVDFISLKIENDINSFILNIVKAKDDVNNYIELSNNPTNQFLHPEAHIKSVIEEHYITVNNNSEKILLIDGGNAFTKLALLIMKDKTLTRIRYFEVIPNSDDQIHGIMIAAKGDYFQYMNVNLDKSMWKTKTYPNSTLKYNEYYQFRPAGTYRSTEKDYIYDPPFNPLYPEVEHKIINSTKFLQYFSNSGEKTTCIATPIFVNDSGLDGNVGGIVGVCSEMKITKDFFQNIVNQNSKYVKSVTMFDPKGNIISTTLNDSSLNIHDDVINIYDLNDNSKILKIFEYRDYDKNKKIGKNYYNYISIRVEEEEFFIVSVEIDWWAMEKVLFYTILYIVLTTIAIISFSSIISLIYGSYLFLYIQRLIGILDASVLLNPDSKSDDMYQDIIKDNSLNSKIWFFIPRDMIFIKNTASSLIRKLSTYFAYLPSDLRRGYLDENSGDSQYTGQSIELKGSEFNVGDKSDDSSIASHASIQSTVLCSKHVSIACIRFICDVNDMTFLKSLYNKIIEALELFSNADIFCLSPDGIYTYIVFRSDNLRECSKESIRFSKILFEKIDDSEYSVCISMICKYTAFCILGTRNQMSRVLGDTITRRLQLMSNNAKKMTFCTDFGTIKDSGLADIHIFLPIYILIDFDDLCSEKGVLMFKCIPNITKGERCVNPKYNEYRIISSLYNGDASLLLNYDGKSDFMVNLQKFVKLEVHETQNFEGVINKITDKRVSNCKSFYKYI